MNNLTSGQIQAILDGAPEGSPYVNVTNQFGAIYLNGSGETHVISDLREIITLRQEVERLKCAASDVCEVVEYHYNGLTDAKAVYKRSLELRGLIGNQLREQCDE